jgi:hypothetical protein
MVVTGSAAMNNVRQIHRYQMSQKKAGRGEKVAQKGTGSAQQQPVAFLPLLDSIAILLALGEPPSASFGLSILEFFQWTALPHE